MRLILLALLAAFVLSAPTAAAADVAGPEWAYYPKPAHVVAVQALLDGRKTTLRASTYRRLLARLKAEGYSEAKIIKAGGIMRLVLINPKRGLDFNVEVPPEVLIRHGRIVELTYPTK